MGKSDELKPILREPESIKELLILLARKSGADHTEIATALGISDRHLRRLKSKAKR